LSVREHSYLSRLRHASSAGLRWFRRNCSEYLVIALMTMAILASLSYLPSLLMPYHYEKHGIRLVSDRQLTDESPEITLRVFDRIKQSELYHSGQSFTVYLCNSRLLYVISSSFRRNKDGVYNLVTRRIILDRNNISGRDALVECIAHEITHRMVHTYLGWKMMVVPAWVSEGYAEYVAHDRLSLIEARELLKHLRTGKLDQDDYACYRLMVTCALTLLHVPLEELFRSPPSAGEVLATLRSSPLGKLLSSLTGNASAASTHNLWRFPATDL